MGRAPCLVHPPKRAAELSEVGSDHPSVPHGPNRACGFGQGIVRCPPLSG
jgi:hypothetical protein